MPPDLAVLTRLVDRHTTGQDRFRAGAWTGIGRVLTGLAAVAFYEAEAQRAAAAELAAIDAAAATASGALTVSYLDAVLTALGVTAAAKIGPPGVLRAADPATVWQRPFEQYRYRASLDGDLDAALDAALTRARQLVDTDLTLAVRDAAARHSTANRAVTGYRRVLRPELSKSGQVCGMCIVAAQNVYRKGDLMPIHQGCNCAVMEVVGDADPGDFLNAAELDAIYDEAGTNRRAELRETRFTITQNSELGPIMAPTKRKRDLTDAI